MFPIVTATVQAVLVVHWVVGQVDPGIANDLKTWTTPVIMAVALVTGLVVPKYVVDRVDRQLSKVEDQRDALAEQLNEVIPVLVQVQTTMIPALDRSQEALRVATAEIVELRRAVATLTERVARGNGA
jgi:hypothetical protein